MTLLQFPQTARVLKGVQVQFPVEQVASLLEIDPTVMPPYNALLAAAWNLNPTSGPGVHQLTCLDKYDYIPRFQLTGADPLGELDMIGKSIVDHQTSCRRCFS